MTSLPWYIARASGFVSWSLLTAAMLWGLLLSTRVLGSRPRANWLLDLHRMLGALALVFTGVHVGALLFDTYVGFGFADVLVPFATHWHPLALAGGITAFYLLCAVELTSLARAHVPRALWRRVHFLSFPLFVVATGHAITAGTDAATWIGLAVVVIGTMAVFSLAALRAVEAGDLAQTTTRDDLAGALSRTSR